MRNLHLSSKTALYLAVCLSIILRLIGLTTRYIWYDEAFSLLISDKNQSAILAGTLAQGNGAAAAEEHPPLYYYLLNGWIRLFGNSVPAARMLSVIAGIGIVLVLYSIARLLFDESTANVALLLLAINPFQIHYSQEIRMYGFMTLWLVLATYTFIRGRNSDNWKWWALFALFSALAQYTHNLSAFYLVALALLPVIQRDWKNLKRVIYSGSAALILYLPWLVHVPAQFAKIQRAYWIERPDLSRFFTLILEYVSDPTLSFGWTAFGLFTALTIFAIGLYQTIRAIRIIKNEFNGGIFLFYLAFMPPLLLFTFSQWFPVYLERGLLPSGGIFCLWLAWVLVRTRVPNQILLMILPMLLISSAAGIYQHLTDSSGVYAPFDKMDEFLQGQYRSNDVIIHSNKLSLLPAYYFNPDLPQVFIADPHGGPTDTLSPATQKILGVASVPDLATAANGATRIWFIILTRSIAEYKAAGAVTHPQLQYLENTYQLDLHTTMGGDEIYLFSRRP